MGRTGKQLAVLVPPVAVRLRRDFGSVLALIRAHALLHQDSRPRDSRGRIVATIADYAVVRELLADVISEGVEKTVKPEVRDGHLFPGSRDEARARMDAYLEAELAGARGPIVDQ
jgi:hypothetical protein